MICRLCLMDISKGEAVLLFDEDAGGNVSGDEKEQDDHQLVKMIANYLYLELSQDDAISTFICIECCTHLKDFHSFWQIIEKKQRTLNDTGSTTMWNCDVNWPDEDVDDVFNINDKGGNRVDTFLATKGSNENDNVNENVNAYNKPHLKRKLESHVHNELDDDDDDHEDGVDMPIELTTHKHKENINNMELTEETTESIVAANDSKQSDPRRPSKLEIHKENEEIVAKFMRLKCPICMDSPETYRSYSDLRDHFNMEHKRPPYVKCCDVIFSRLSRLVEHVHWHLNPSEFTCSFCLKTMRSKKSLQNHLKCAHNSELPDMETAKSSNKLGNEVSHNQRTELTNTTNLTAEQIPSGGEFVIVSPSEDNGGTIESSKLYTCDTCGQYFNCNIALERHLLEHFTNFEPLLHGTSLNGDQHLLQHTLNTLTLENLSNNIVQLKKDKKFQCQYCEKSFKLRRYLEEHIATHTGAKLHTCPHCTTEFRCKSNMYAHIKRKHQKEWIQAHESKKLNNQKQNCAPLIIVSSGDMVNNFTNNHNIINNNNNNIINSSNGINDDDKIVNINYGTPTIISTTKTTTATSSTTSSSITASEEAKADT